MSDRSLQKEIQEIMAIPKQGPVIAIDGPAGTGKSSVTRRLADLLGLIHVDTGALYRSIAYLGIQAETRGDRVDYGELARSTHLEFKRVPNKNPGNRIFANGKDVTDFIRTPEVSMAASRVSADPPVRAALLGLQRRLGCAGRAILEGRDIGTVIFPDADVKFFMNATVEERAKRRLIELEAMGSETPSYEEVKKQIAERDRGDSTRAVAPLKKANDATEIDTTTLTLDQVVDRMAEVIESKVAGLKRIK